MITPLLTLALFVGSASASEQLEIKSFSAVTQKIREVGQKYGNDNILTVFDTDDTLLVLNQAIGSEAWFEWQNSEVQCESRCTPKMQLPPGENAIAKNFVELLDQVGKILFLSHAHPNESEIPQALRLLQTDGIKTIVLTSRGFLNRDATVRQYKENGITFSPVGLSATEEGHEYIPQITLEEAKKFGITSVRPVNYTHGIINSDGQHKGVMLAAWLREMNQHPTALVFVDNESKNTNRVYSVFEDSKIDITTIRYSAADATRLAFWESDKTEAINQWNAVRALLVNVFGK